MEIPHGGYAEVGPTTVVVVVVVGGVVIVPQPRYLPHRLVLGLAAEVVDLDVADDPGLAPRTRTRTLRVDLWCQPQYFSLSSGITLV